MWGQGQNDIDALSSSLAGGAAHRPSSPGLRWPGRGSGAVTMAMASLIFSMLLMCTALMAAAFDSSPEECAALRTAFEARHWTQLDGPPAGAEASPPQLYFIHIPRTAGKTCFTCFLKAATPPSQRCLKAYDSPRLDLDSPNCTLISSHDDYSLTAVSTPHPGWQGARGAAPCACTQPSQLTQWQRAAERCWAGSCGWASWPRPCRERGTPPHLPFPAPCPRTCGPGSGW